MRGTKPTIWLERQIGARLTWGLATGLGLASLGVAGWGLDGVLMLGVLGAGLALLGYWLEATAQTSKPKPSTAWQAGPSAPAGGPRVRARVTIQPPPPVPIGEAEVAQMLTELRPVQAAPQPEAPAPDPKMLRRYRRLREAGMQPLFEPEALCEVA